MNLRFLFSLIWPLVLLAVSSGFAQTRYETSIQASDGILLDATYFVPSTPQPHGGYPAIIFVHGFAMSKSETEASAEVYAEMGYFTLAYSVRGHGNSQGLSTVMSRKERDDLKTIVNFVAGRPEVNSRAIGVTGGSQGGLHGLWAAADNLPVAAITADVIGPRWASDMLANGCYRSTLPYLLSANTVRFDPVVDSLLNLLIADDFDGFYNAFVPDRDIDTVAFSLARTPLVLFGKWQDHYFRANEGISAYQTYRAHRDAQKLYVGTGGHYSDDIPSEWNYQFDWITRWFDQFLMRQQTGILREPDITYAFSSLPMDTNGYFTWAHRTLTDWPPLGIAPLRLYLAEGGTLSMSPPQTGAGSRLLVNDYRDTSYSLYYAFWDDFEGEWFDSSFHQQTLAFQTQALQSDVDWVGIPRFHLSVSSDADRFPVIAQIYEADSTGAKYFVNRIDFEGRKNDPGSVRVLDVSGNAHAHHFKAGNFVRVELTNLDKTNRKLMGSHPFVVPVFERSRTTIFMDAIHPAYIELPVLPGGPPLQVARDDPPAPAGYSLSQNYPNPFNPVTHLHFSIAKLQLVTLKVYDVLGREIATLVNETKPPGEYAVEWDAANQPSGVYYYRLQAGTFVATKKLVHLE